MHNLFYLAKGYDSRDLMNRVLDKIQAFDQRCGGSMYRCHLRTIYTKTTIGSPLRWYYSVASASFLALATDSTKYQKRADKIMAFRNLNHNFKADLGRARNQLKKKIKLGRLDFRDQTSFGICEFHTHRKGDLCHTTIPLAQASTTATRASETRALAREVSILSNAAEEDLDASDQRGSGSEGEASSAGESDSDEEYEDTDNEYEDASSKMDLDILGQDIDPGSSVGPSNHASMLPAMRNQHTPESLFGEHTQHRHRERAPSAETKFGDAQMTGLDTQVENDFSERPVRMGVVHNIQGKSRVSRNRDGRITPPFSEDSAMDQLLQATHRAAPSEPFSHISSATVPKSAMHIIFDSDGDQSWAASPSILAAHHRFSKKTHGHSKGAAAKDGNKKNRQAPASDIHHETSPNKFLSANIKPESVEEDIYTVTPPPASVGPSRTPHNHVRNGKRPQDTPQGPKRSQPYANRSGAKQKRKDNSYHRDTAYGVQKHRQRGRKRRYGQPGQRGKFTATASTPSNRGDTSPMIFKSNSRTDLEHVHPSRMGRITYNRAAKQG
jgi:hypothetical protein